MAATGGRDESRRFRILSTCHSTAHEDLATISYARAKQVVLDGPVLQLDVGEVLGHAIAHEIRHLLLGLAHSPRGLMSAHWPPEELRLASRNQLNFFPMQGASLRSGVRVRMQEEECPKMMPRTAKCPVNGLGRCRYSAGRLGSLMSASLPQSVQGGDGGTS